MAVGGTGVLVGGAGVAVGGRQQERIGVASQVVPRDTVSGVGSAQCFYAAASVVDIAEVVRAFLLDHQQEGLALT